MMTDLPNVDKVSGGDTRSKQQLYFKTSRNEIVEDGYLRWMLPVEAVQCGKIFIQLVEQERYGLTVQVATGRCEWGVDIGMSINPDQSFEITLVLERFGVVDREVIYPI